MHYLDKKTLRRALENLHGTADHMLKIWFTLKQMGMTEDKSVEVTTSSPTAALQRLFGYGHPDGIFFIPFAHTTRFKTMKADAARSVVQTNIKQWAENTAIGVNPSSLLSIERSPTDSFFVSPSRQYPSGLGLGKNGFSLEDGTRVSIPLVAFSVWYYRQSEVSEDETGESLAKRLAADLSLTNAEIDLIFVRDELSLSFSDRPLTDSEVFATANENAAADLDVPELLPQTQIEHLTKIKSMITLSPGPGWLNADPVERFKKALASGAKTLLLYGPPRTGKTHVIDSVVERSSTDRVTIQIHDGWGYEDLVLGLKPKEGGWSFKEGPLLEAIRAGKKFIVLEEINRTDFSQAIGDIFSLFEEAYRGPEHSITLKDGSSLHVPEDVTFICTMNNLDKSTEEVDDALFGRMSAIEFSPRVEDLHRILSEKGISEDLSEKLRQLYAAILQYYPLGHAYFAEIAEKGDVRDYYLSRIRPVLQKHLQNFRDDHLRAIDEQVESLFGDK